MSDKFGKEKKLLNSLSMLLNIKLTITNYDFSDYFGVLLWNSFGILNINLDNDVCTDTEKWKSNSVKVLHNVLCYRSEHWAVSANSGQKEFIRFII